MELQEFVANFAEQFEQTDKNVFSPETKFRELDEWDSIIGLGVLSMVGEEYGIAMQASDLKKATTIREFFEIVQSKE